MGTLLDDFEVESYSPANVHARAATALVRVCSHRCMVDIMDDDDDDDVIMDSWSDRVHRWYNVARTRRSSVSCSGQRCCCPLALARG